MIEKLLSDISFSTSGFLLDILLPCILAVIFGAIIGFQREKTERPAGLRTHALVCLGSTVFTLVSYSGFSAGASFDSTRIAAGVVTGIGFIGAGAIFRQGPLVKGVTTAASIWTVAAIGLSLGTKLYYLALLVTILGFLILSILKFFEDRIIRLPRYFLRITVSGDFKELETVINFLAKISTDISCGKYELDPGTDKKIFGINTHSRDHDFSLKAINGISRIQGVEKINIS
ncbi:MAG: MgtC/SapB family protein [Actinobacteria bacterium]|nr:MgtC/SapB family protein [Actinomycetota bacterium]